MAAVLAAAVLLGPEALADRRDQRAADLYTEGVRLIREGKYREGATKINAALARGATEPVDAQGSETRFQARPYDPYYWLGVAQMETGLREQALANFEKSSTIVPKGRTLPVLADAPAEWADLSRRKALLLASLEVPTPAAVAAVATLAPTATPFTLRLPERPTVPPPTAVAALPPPTPATSPGGVPLPATALALREDLAALLADPAVSLRAGGLLRAGLSKVETALGRGAKAAEGAERALRGELAGEPGAAVLAAALEASLEAHRERRYAEAARLAEVVARLRPAAPQPHLVRAVALETLWLLDGEKSATLEAAARLSYGEWRARRPAGAPVPPFLSPALREKLERPVPVPSHA